MNLDNPFAWIFFAIFLIGYFIVKELARIHQEVKGISLILNEIEMRGRLPTPETLEEWRTQRENR